MRSIESNACQGPSLIATPPSAAPAEVPSARERLLEAAFDVFAERGYAGTSTREICRRASANAAALNYHWGSKDRLWLAVTERCAALYREALERGLALRTGADAGEIVARSIEAVFDLLAADPRPVRVVLWATLQAESVDYEASVSVFDALVDRSIEALRALQAAGLIGPEVDVEVAGPLLHSQIAYAFADGAGHRRYYGKDLGDPEHAARFRAELVRATCAALGVQPPARP